MIVFCSACGSDKVDIAQWDNKERVLFRCSTCEQQRWVEGFTLSELDFAGALVGAVLDQARKYRKRSPEAFSRALRKKFDEKRAAQRR